MGPKVIFARSRSTPKPPDSQPLTSKLTSPGRFVPDQNIKMIAVAKTRPTLDDTIILAIGQVGIE